MCFETTNHRLLIIDDNTSIHEDFRKILCGADEDQELSDDEFLLFGKPAESQNLASFEIISAQQGQEGLAKLMESLADDEPFAVAFVDVRMPPGWDGVETIQHLWEADSRLQVVICTAHSDYTPRDILDRLGESDRLLIIKKPFDQDEVRLAATALCEKWSLARKAEMKQAELERQVFLRTDEVVQTRDVTVFALAKLAESRDPETGEHLFRMRAYSQILAEQLSESGPYAKEVNLQFLDDLYRSSPLHDIGKVGISDQILCKPGRLTNEEFDAMKEHSSIGANTLAEAVHHTSAGSFLSMAIDIARYHHERFDGSGYPEGLSGTDIPLAARIVAVADVFDALTSQRVYKAAISPKVAYDMILEQRGKHFDPDVVDAFVARFEDFLNVTREHSDLATEHVEQKVLV